MGTVCMHYLLNTKKIPFSSIFCEKFLSCFKYLRANSKYLGTSLTGNLQCTAFKWFDPRKINEFWSQWLVQIKGASLNTSLWPINFAHLTLCLFIDLLSISNGQKLIQHPKSHWKSVLFIKTIFCCPKISRKCQLMSAVCLLFSKKKKKWC